MGPKEMQKHEDFASEMWQRGVERGMTDEQVAEIEDLPRLFSTYGHFRRLHGRQRNSNRRNMILSLRTVPRVLKTQRKMLVDGERDDKEDFGELWRETLYQHSRLPKHPK